MGSRSDESHLWANLSVTALGYYIIGKVSALSQHPVSSDADVNHHILLAARVTAKDFHSKDFKFNSYGL